MMAIFFFMMPLPVYDLDDRDYIFSEEIPWEVTIAINRPF
jgi:hypothetical protein